MFDHSARRSTSLVPNRAKTVRLRERSERAPSGRAESAKGRRAARSGGIPSKSADPAHHAISGGSIAGRWPAPARMLYSIIRPNTYQDSLRLMHLSRALNGIAGIDRVSILMGTPANKEILRDAGLGAAELERARPTDLVIVADVADAAVGDLLLAKVDDFLRYPASVSDRSRLRSARSLERAVGMLGQADLAVVSIPGQYVASEVHRLLDRNIHAFIFSDNVSIEDEVALKRKARERGLLVMLSLIHI